MTRRGPGPGPPTPSHLWAHGPDGSNPKRPWSPEPLSQVAVAPLVAQDPDPGASPATVLRTWLDEGSGDAVSLVKPTAGPSSLLSRQRVCTDLS